MQNVAIVSFLTISMFSLAISCHGAAEPSHVRYYELLGLEHAISARSLKDPELL